MAAREPRPGQRRGEEDLIETLAALCPSRATTVCTKQSIARRLSPWK
jgi:hypothetical protein